MSDRSVLEIWMEYCKLQAFQKIYSLFLRKKSFYGIVIIVFDVPFKILKLFFYFIFRTKFGLKLSLENLYFKSYCNLKNCKIEILNWKIYLNCHTLAKLAISLGMLDKTSKKNVLGAIKDLKKEVAKFEKIEKKSEEFQTFYLGDAYHKDGEIYKSHYTFFENSATIHATSNVPKELLASQKVDSPLPTLTKFGSRNPGSIITTDVKHINTYGKFKKVPKHELDAIKFNHQETFIMDVNSSRYMSDKNMAYWSILHHHIRGNEVYDKKILDKLRIGCFNNVLLNMSNDEIEKELDELEQLGKPFF